MPSYFAEAFHLPPQEAVEIFIKMGAYPGAFGYIHDFSRWKACVRDAIVETAIGRDIMSLAPIRKPALLRQVFAYLHGSSRSNYLTPENCGTTARCRCDRDHITLSFPSRRSIPRGSCF